MLHGDDILRGVFGHTLAGHPVSARIDKRREPRPEDSEGEAEGFPKDPPDREHWNQCERKSESGKAEDHASRISRSSEDSCDKSQDGAGADEKSAEIGESGRSRKNDAAILPSLLQRGIRAIKGARQLGRKSQEESNDAEDAERDRKATCRLLKMIWHDSVAVPRRKSVADARLRLNLI